MRMKTWRKRPEEQLGSKGSSQLNGKRKSREDATNLLHPDPALNSSSTLPAPRSYVPDIELQSV